MKKLFQALMFLFVVIHNQATADSVWQRFFCSRKISPCRAQHSFVSKLVRCILPKSRTLPYAMRQLCDLNAQRVEPPVSNDINQPWEIVDHPVINFEENCKWVKESWAIPHASYKGFQGNARAGFGVVAGFSQMDSAWQWISKNEIIKQGDSFVVVPTDQMAPSDL